MKNHKTVNVSQKQLTFFVSFKLSTKLHTKIALLNKIIVIRNNDACFNNFKSAHSLVLSKT